MTAETVRPLDAAALRAAVLGPFWHRLDVVDETGSTNADLIARDDPAGAVLLAENQSAGRGRNGRTWSGTPGASILMSFGVSTAGVGVDGWGWVPLLTGVAVLDALAACGVQAGLKWPNDVLVGDRKLAGILAEVSASRRAIVVGVGLNVTPAASAGTAAFAGSAALAATSVAEHTATAPDRAVLIGRLLTELGERLDRWRAAGGADEKLIADYRDRSVTIGSRVRALLPGDRQIVGLASAVDGQGRLQIDTGAGSELVSAGDIVHLRRNDGAESG
jgi:BirA family biotin operon repressor/biotin-[acetyl-CoA-carboxylase] ligase